MRTNKIKIIGAAAALAAVMAIPVATAAQDETAKVRVGHFSPDAPAVDIYVNGEIFAGLEDVEFGVLSDYVEVPADTYEVAVVLADQDPAEATVIGPAPIELAAGSVQTIAATGFAGGQEPVLAPVILNDDFMLEEGKAQVRVVHFSPDAPAVDIAPDGEEALIPGLAFPGFAGYVALDEGEYDLEVRLADTDTVALQLDPLMLAGNTAYTVFAIGSASGDEALPALQPLVVVDDVAEMSEEMTEETTGE
jgi:hypothetical protein